MGAVLVAQIRRVLEARGLSARAAALEAGLPIRSIQGALEGHSPSVANAGKICAALGLEFYIGPTRSAGNADTAPPEACVPSWADLLRHLDEIEKLADQLSRTKNVPAQSERIRMIRDIVAALRIGVADRATVKER